VAVYRSARIIDTVGDPLLASALGDSDAQNGNDTFRSGVLPIMAAGSLSTATPLPPGTVAPAFELPCTPDQTLSLGDFRGQPLILAFYPEDWSPVCSDQMALYQEVLPEFRKFNAELLGTSVDGVWCHLAFAKDRNLHFPLLADFEPKGEVSRAYQVYRAKDGTSERALYVIDADGIVRWSYVSPVGLNPGADGILRALENLGTENAS
jgi:peroxiredoxin